MAAPSIVLFDGVCNLCNGFVNFIIDRDPQQQFQFASLQSSKAATLLKGQDNKLLNLTTVVLIEGSTVYTQSTAALRIARRLRGGWPLLYGLIIVPRPLRDVIYRFIAKRRYRWFGQRDTCRIPTPELRSRFIE
jgi:predicted DCC family thiol-disulfide oxidoreductase YuxK